MHAANPNAFTGSDSFDFVALAAPSAYGDSRAYYLSVGSSAGLRMGTTGAAKASGRTREDIVSACCAGLFSVPVWTIPRALANHRAAGASQASWPRE